MDNKNVYDFSEFVKEEERTETCIKIKDKEFSIKYNAYNSLKLTQLSRREDLSDDELAKEIIIFSLGEDAWNYILEINVTEYGLRNILGIVLLTTLEIKTPKEIKKMSEKDIKK